MSEASKCPPAAKCIPAILIAASLIISAFLIQSGLTHFRSYERVVTLKGLATQDVEADIAAWPITHVVTGDDLAALQTQIEENSKKIKDYLFKQGLTSTDIASKSSTVYDKLAQAYGDNNIQSNRYILTENMMISTSNLDAVDKAVQNTGDLIKEGVTLVRDMDPMGNGNPSYIYTKLNDVKPAMIAEATKNARESAEQFARDSGASVGGIHQADQGLFIILPRNSDNSYMERASRNKTVRVVSTLKFYIE